MFYNEIINAGTGTPSLGPKTREFGVAGVNSTGRGDCEDGAAVEGLIAILEGLAQSMAHWTYETKPRVKGVTPQQWEVDHEYHVQNLLWTVLRPVFSELVDEQSLPKVGHKTPRYDLGVPSLGTIVEVKFMRKAGSTACREIIEEIAADRSLYLAPNSGYSRLVVFIWDGVPSNRGVSNAQRRPGKPGWYRKGRHFTAAGAHGALINWRRTRSAA